MPSALRASRPSALLRVLAVAATVALPLLATAPASAAGDPLAGRSLTGQLVQAYPESRGEAGQVDTPLSWVQPRSGAPVRVDTADLAGVPAGATVRVTMGGTVDDGVSGTVGTAHSVTASDVLDPTGDATAAATPSDTTAAPTTPAGTATTDPTGADTTSETSGPTGTSTAAAGLTDRVWAVLVKAGDGAPDGTTVQDLEQAVDGPVHDFWAGQTGGAVDLGVVSETSWTTTPGCDTPTKLWDDAAAAAGFVPGPGNHLLVYVSTASKDIADCSYGLAEIGSGLGSGGRLYVQDALPSLIAHELGHNFGLGHSSGKQCEGAVDTGTCQVQPYQDYYDVMAASWEHVGTLNAAQEARLGVLPGAQQRTLTATGPGGSVTLAPLGGHTGVRAVELTAGDGTEYWIEYRAAVGQDAWLDTATDRLGLQSGVLLHRSGSLPDTSLLLDGTPSPAISGDADVRVALPIGQPVALADGFSVTVTGESAGGASVMVATTPATTQAAVSSAPARACRATSCRTAPATGSLPAAQQTLGTPFHYPVVASGGQADQVGTAQVHLRTESLRSPVVLGAAGAVLACAALLGWTISRRFRRPSFGRRG